MIDLIINFLTNNKIATAITIITGLATIIGGCIFSEKFRNLIKTIFLFLLKIIKNVLPNGLVNIFEKKTSTEELRVEAKRLIRKGTERYYPEIIPGVCDLIDYYIIDNDETHGLYEKLGFVKERNVFRGYQGIAEILGSIESGKYDKILKKFFKKVKF